MKRAPLYSRPPADRSPDPGPVQLPRSFGSALTWRNRMHRPPLWLALLLCAWVASSLTWALTRYALPAPAALTQGDIDAAVLHTLNTQDLPSRAARAAQRIAPAVVRVRTQDEDKKNPKGELQDSGVGSGVVISEEGIILTNLHVVQGARRIKVRFHNGHESEAQLINIQPENDLAVLKAQSLPDDLEAATMRSTSDLRPGDQVVAVGHPFGIGPSTSGGVVSGLRREFRDPEGKKMLTNLIQFDAAANPGNSGGPLVTMDGHVVGIVTAILNPTEARTFIGIGFAVPIENAASAVGMPPF